MFSRATLLFLGILMGVVGVETAGITSLGLLPLLALTISSAKRTRFAYFGVGLAAIPAFGLLSRSPAYNLVDDVIYSINVFVAAALVARGMGFSFTRPSSTPR